MSTSRGYHTAEDPNLEHYHYKTFIDYIDKQKALTDHSLTDVLELMEQEKDGSMSASVLLYLLKRGRLPGNQLQLLPKH